MEEQNIKGILTLVKTKKPQGFELLYQYYFRFMFSVSYSVLNNEQDSYDVLQSVMLRLYMLDEKLFPSEHEMSWLKTVVKNEALVHRRKEKTTVPLEDVVELPVQEQRIDDFIDMEQFNALAETLNERQRKVVTMKIMGNMTHKEIAQMLSIPIGTVQWLYNTSIRELRRVMMALAAFALLCGGWNGLSIRSIFAACGHTGRCGHFEHPAGGTNRIPLASGKYRPVCFRCNGLYPVFQIFRQTANKTVFQTHLIEWKPKSTSNAQGGFIMKRFLSLGLASLLTLGMVTGCTSAETTDDIGGSVVRFDFEQDDSGFTPIFADYPDMEDAESLYEFRHEYGSIPIDGAGKGIFISGSNQSADLFMGYVKMLDGFVPGRTYRFSVTFKLATDVEGGQVGIGGAPGESVAVKCGLTAVEPQAIAADDSFGGYFRLNIDAGAQSNGGKDMVVVGDIAKAENNHPGEYEFKEFQAELETAANAQGEVYLVIGADSGFEAVTSYYLDDISVQWEDTDQPTAVQQEDIE